MQRAAEIALIEELLELSERRQFTLSEGTYRSPIERYRSNQRFGKEWDQLFRRAPMIAAHSSQLPTPDAFLTRDFAGLPVLLARDRAGSVHAFLNVCRHRGARLEPEAAGCKRAFSCPYHAWTYSNTGALRGIPHQKAGFPEIDKSAHALVRLPVLEREGLIWCIADPAREIKQGEIDQGEIDQGEIDIDAFVEPLLADLEWLRMDQMAIISSDTLTIDANWKLLVEGGIEAYHFKVAHKQTIGPHFQDNLSTFQRLGAHMRSVLPRNSLLGLRDEARGAWQIRAHANVLYTLFPADQFLVMEDHVAWVSLTPLSAAQTEVRLSTLAPAEAIQEPKDRHHFERNHMITKSTLLEDFDLNESAQRGISSGANTDFLFGRFEGALQLFNEQVEAWLGAESESG